jgi:hypothetical protein
MEWSDEDVGCAWQEWRSTPTRDMDDALRRVMSLAVDLVAASGGTMTAEELAESLHVREDEESGWWRDLAPRLREHIVTQVATLQAKVEELTERLAARDHALSGCERERLAVIQERNALRAEVERLRTENRLQESAVQVRDEQLERCRTILHETGQRAEATESRLAAIRESIAPYAGLRDDVVPQAVARIRVALEGDAPQEAKDTPLASTRCRRPLGSGSIRLLCQLSPKHEGPCKPSP